MELTKIVITGGPCAGKSTAMSRIQKEFSALGYTVLFVPETATELITGGVAPWTCGRNVEYQKCQMRLQLVKEALFEQAARTMPAEKILIVCDRGNLDNKAYMDEDEFAEALEYIGLNKVELRDNYDAVFHLVTAAKGEERFYTTENNSARIETVEQATALDDRLIDAWTGHPHFRVIDNSENFEEKMARLIKEISVFLGEPEKRETERKFLIERPDISLLESIPACRPIDILQTYLKSEKDEEIRVRRRGEDGHYVYFHTVKRKINGLKREENERRITKEEYLSLLEEADESKKPISKTRYCLTYKNQYLEIDIYPFMNDTAILEIELCDGDEEIFFPESIKVIKEVTFDDEYKNSSLAAKTQDT